MNSILKNNLSIAFLLCISLFLLGNDTPPVKTYTGKKLDIYILIGQSNMAGRAKLTDELKKPMKQVYLLNNKNEFEVATNPLNQYSTIRKNINVQQLGPGYGFANAMITNDQIEIGLIVNAKGGSSIQSWVKGKKFYEEILKRANAASEYGTIKGILWHQGESDSGSATYLSDLEKLITDLRTDLKNPNLPFVAGQIFKQGDFNKNILTLPKLVKHTGVVSSEGLTAKDGTHFDTKSQLIFGKRYAEAMNEIK